MVTKEELEEHKNEFDKYEKIRTSGEYNMFAYYSIYGWVMEHYEDLAKAYPEIIKKYE
jgi:hypothetical protein